MRPWVPRVSTPATAMKPNGMGSGKLKVMSTRETVASPNVEAMMRCGPLLSARREATRPPMTAPRFSASGKNGA
jgi:hypothetical protein